LKQMVWQQQEQIVALQVLIAQVGLVLWFNDVRVDQRKKPCIRVNIRELNGVFSTMYLPIYTN